MNEDRRCWDEQLETLAPERRRLLREHRLRWQLRRCWDGSPFYRARLEAAGLDPATFNGLSDWQRLPILRTADLPDLADWAVAPEPWWDHVDSAPDLPSRAVTDGDAIHEADLAARALWAHRARPHLELRLPDPQLSLLTRQQIIVGAARLGAKLVIGREPFASDQMWPFMAPVFFICREGEQLHWNDDHFLIEIVEPGSGDPAQPGTEGAVVMTDLAREGSPLLRYWLGNRTVLSSNPCACGRTSVWSRWLA